VLTRYFRQTTLGVRSKANAIPAVLGLLVALLMDLRRQMAFALTPKSDRKAIIGFLQQIHH
jgi:hypothetical protein